MRTNPFASPGGDPFKKPGGTPATHDDIFTKPKWPSRGGGGRPKAKPAEASEPVEEAQPLLPEKSEANKSRPKVILSNLKWSAESGEFNEKATVSVTAELPVELKHLTRIEFIVFAQTPDGKRESIDKQEGHILDGLASSEVTLYWPQYRIDGNPLAECDFLFTAKHRESKAEESPILKVSGPRDPIGKIWVKLVDRKGKPLAGLECDLKGKKQAYPKRKLDGAGAAIWEGLPLDEYSLNFKIGTTAYFQSAPWLAKSADIHVQRVKAIQDAESLQPTIAAH